jgi:1-deoxy-D-xylulose-5-phosphate synthase
MQPKDEDELVDMLHTSLQLEGPGFIRYPRGAGTGATIKDQPVAQPIGQAEVFKQGYSIKIWALGSMVTDALELAGRLEREDGLSVGVVNARFVKPLDRALLLSHAACIPLIVTLEDNVLAGGFGSAVLEELQASECTTCEVERLGWPDRFVDHASSVADLRAQNGLSPDDLHRKVLERWRNRHHADLTADV